MTTNFTLEDLGDNLLDVQDIIDAYEKLCCEYDPEVPNSLSESDQTTLDFINESILGELASYTGDIKYNGDWYPSQLIADYHFTDYARELAEDVYYHDLKDVCWPFTHIDWAGAADEIKQDYNVVDISYNGKTYFYYYR